MRNNKIRSSSSIVSDNYGDQTEEVGLAVQYFLRHSGNGDISSPEIGRQWFCIKDWKDNQ